MHHSKTVFDKAFAHAEHTKCLFDMEHQLIALVDNHQQILGVLQFELRDDNYAQIETLATAAEKKGYGYRLYLTALAALSPGMQLIPQACQDSDVCLDIWYKFYMEPDITKTSLNGTKHYRFEFDATYSHELAGLNPDIICEQWDAWEITDDIYTHVKSGELNPHPSNVSFTLPVQRRAHIAKTVTPYVFTAAQIDALNKCLSLDYESLGAPAADILRQGVSFPAPGQLVSSAQAA